MKIRLFLAVVSLVALLSLSASEVLAVPNFSSATLNTPGNSKIFVLPPEADNSPVISLGGAIDPATGKQVEGIMFIHYKKGFSHKPGHNPGGGGGTTCYSYLASGAKWKTPEDWVMNSANSQALDETTLFNTQASALAKWEDAADGVVGSGLGFNIFGDGTQTSDVLAADESAPDERNEVYFAEISDPNVIAVTIVWGYFGGPPFARELIEWDQVYDDVEFDWSVTGEATKMDFDNIASHEDGHAAGMGHPASTCVDETMYAYADDGEIKKRDLNAGDIAGINKLY